MLFRGKTIWEIEEDDLLSLIGTTNESQEVDFKVSAYPAPPESQLPTDQRERDKVKNKWKIDLCTDVTAFANASGGWIICGMDEEEGIAKELCGLGTTIDGEREVSRLEKCILSGTEPTIQGFRIRPINLLDAVKSKAIVIYIPRSYSAPHRVKETSKFYIRRSNRNDEMNVDELRAAFNLSVTLSDRIKGFREERVKVITAKDGHEDVILEPGIRHVLHVIPLTFSDIGKSVNLKSLEFIDKSFNDSLRSAFTSRLRFGFDGLVMPIYYKEGQAREYFQVFRNGAIEYVDVRSRNDGLAENFIYPFPVEDRTLLNLEIALKMQRNLGVEPPLVVMLSLLGVKGCRFSIRNDFYYGKSPIINRDTILIPDVVMEDYDQELTDFMHPIFDILWNTGGYNASPSYDNRTGNWIRQ